MKTNDSTPASEIPSIVEHAMDGSYQRGIFYGITEAQIILLNILNECKFQITVEELQKEFMIRTNEKLTK